MLTWMPKNFDAQGTGCIPITIRDDAIGHDQGTKAGSIKILEPHPKILNPKS